MPSQAKKKPAPSAGNPTPQFRVVGKDESAKSGGLNFGALTKTAEKKSKTPSHPLLTLQGEGIQLAGQYLEHAPTFKDLEKLVGSKGSIKAQLRPHIIAAYFRHFAGRALDDSRCLTSVNGTEIKLT